MFVLAEFRLPKPHPSNSVHRRREPDIRVRHERAQSQGLRNLCEYCQVRSVGQILTNPCRIFFRRTVEPDASAQTRVRTRRGRGHGQVSVRPAGQLDSHLVGKGQPGTVTGIVQRHQRRVHQGGYGHFPNGPIQLDYGAQGVRVQEDAEIRFKLARQ